APGSQPGRGARRDLAAVGPSFLGSWPPFSGPGRLGGGTGGRRRRGHLGGRGRSGGAGAGRSAGGLEARGRVGELGSLPRELARRGGSCPRRGEPRRRLVPSEAALDSNTRHKPRCVALTASRAGYYDAFVVRRSEPKETCSNFTSPCS